MKLDFLSTFDPTLSRKSGIFLVPHLDVELTFMGK